MRPSEDASGTTPVRVLIGVPPRDPRRLRHRLDEGGIKVVDEAHSGVEVVARATELNPEIVLLDLGLPEAEAQTVAGRLKHVLRTTKVLSLLERVRPGSRHRVPAVGLDGYLREDRLETDLVRCVRLVARDIYLFDLGLLIDVIDAMEDRTSAGPPESDLLLRVSPRERLILRCLSHGMSDQEVAVLMNLSTGQAKNAICRVAGKMSEAAA